jgi:hypothetical protein
MGSLALLRLLHLAQEQGVEGETEDDGDHAFT